ncbi:TraK domain-containing protein [Rubrivivax gelatinosus]|uniref:TraK domain-containing protein n=1 Tax=Rubrivivax gelatinosus TaxID=28068 RepID=UPI001A1D3D6C|nr:type-F conjugative transfer system secretin TraK [Rubrivivax gelatinosus]MBG6083010.1 conjugal transfer pilus assembly protein TraK [Rubrivivax gelatinosus]
MKHAIALAIAAMALNAAAQTLPPPPAVHQPKSESRRAAAPAPAARAESQAPEAPQSHGSPVRQGSSAAGVQSKPGEVQPVDAVPSARTDEGMQKRPPAQLLPGVGLMPGPQELLRPQVVNARAGKTDTVYVSSSMPNRIATPFDAPRLVHDKKEVEYEVVGQSIYVIPINSDKPVGIYVTGSNPNDEVVSLTLVPKQIVQQTVTIQLDGGGAQGMHGDEGAPAANDPYSERIRYVLRQVAMNKVPDGFAEGALPKAVAALPGAILAPISRYSGSAFDIYRYQLTGTSAEPIELSEEAFYEDGVRAVSFFPTAVLQRGERTTVFVIADKTATGR